MFRMNARWFAILSAFLLTTTGCGRTDTGSYPGGGSGGGGGGGGGGVGCPLGCDRGFLCQSSRCVLDPTGRWTVRVTTGTVAARNASGSQWDGDASPPDPKVCLTMNGSRLCTRTIQDTFSPSWNEDFPSATATALQAGVLVEYLESDFSFDDPICTGTVPVSASDFASGSWGIQCQGGLGQVSARLTAQ